MKVTVTVTATEKAEIRRRAKLHGLSMSAYLRTAALGTFGAPEDDPDVVWLTIPRERRAGIISWLMERGRPKRRDEPTLPFDEHPGGVH